MNTNEFPDALPPEHRLHWYVLERVLGQGGFGITYVARDTNLDKTVAIKEYLPVEVATRRPDSSVRSRTEDQAHRYRGGLERFIREARTLARFDHPNIVRVHSVFEFNGTAYMVMRFEEGETLAALLERRHALPEPELKRVLMPILEGLELVHGAGFIHRDIKPDNILIRTDGSPVLLDFGSARYALGQARTVTILVAPGYAPIEQYYDSGESQGPWTDIYGLGATCYRAVAGHAPMDAIARSKGKLGSTQEMLLPALVAGHGRYSERFLGAIDRALEFSERDRPQTIAEWRNLLEEERKPAPVASAPAPLSAAVPPGTHAAPSRARRREPWLWAAGGAVGMLAVLALFFGWNRMEPVARKDAPDPPPAVVQGTDNIEELRKQIADLKSERSETETRLAAMLQRAVEAEEKRKEAEPPKRVEPAPPKRATETQPAARPVVGATAPSVARTVPAKTEAPVVAPRESAPAKDEPPKMAAAVPVAKPETSATPVERAPPLPPPPPKDPMSQLRSLVEGNDATAMVKLGDFYLAGEGVERSDQEAARLFRRAADAGNMEAQLRLGDLYSKGRGVPQNNFQAYVWYSAAARSGSSAARTSQERAGQLLQAAEIQQARKLVDAMSRKDK